MKILCHILFCFVLAAVVPAVTLGPAFGQPQPGEYEVKAAFLYNFLSFVEWPATVKRSDTLRVCVMAEPPALNAFNELNGQIAAGRKIDAVHLSPGDSPGSCHVLFIGSHAELDLPRIMKAVEGAGVLTVGDTAGFARQGVIINFYLQNKKVRFEINAAAARRSGITISSKLLKLAGAVYGAAPAGE
ncbi:MAG TPA: YfiR family protein [Nitrospirota bacterium]